MVAMQNYSNQFNSMPQGLPQLPPPPANNNAAPASTPEASGVKINIYNPQAYSGSKPQQAPAQPQQNPQHSIYAMPQSSVYGMPQGSVYNQPQPMAALMPKPQQAMMPAPQPQEAPSAPQAQQVINKITPPPPAIDQQQESEPIKLEQQPQGAPPEKKPEAEPQAPKAEQAQQPMKNEPAAQEAQKPKSTISVQGLNAALKSQNVDQQTDAIQKVAEIGQSNTPESNELLNEETFKGLSNVITKDNSKLQGPEKEKADVNKMLGMWSLAILQNNMRDQMNTEAKKQGIPSMTIKDLPGVPEIVSNVKNDSNPTIRAAGISAINYLAKPEDKEIVTPIYKNALNDSSPDVKAAAKEALAKMQGPEPAEKAKPQGQTETKPAAKTA